MDEAKWERAAGAGGILFVVLVLVSALLPGSPPMTSDPPREIADFFADNGDAIRQAAFLGIIATLPIVWWGAAIFRRMERATGNVRLGVMTAIGIAIAATAAGLSSVVYATIAIAGVDGAGGLEGMSFYYQLGTGMNSMVGIGTALAVGAVSAAILRTGMMPKLVGWFGALVAVLAFLGSAVAVSTRDAVMGLTFIGFLAFALWLLIVSIVMLRGPAAVPATVPESA